jgi:hypothetical protein
MLKWMRLIKDIFSLVELLIGSKFKIYVSCSCCHSVFWPPSERLVFWRPLPANSSVG